MITPLRKRHRWLAPAAFVSAVAGLAVALGARPDEFVDAARPDPGTRLDAPARSTGAEDANGRFVVTWTSTDMTGGASEGWRLRIAPREPLDAPDLLIYLADEVDPGGAIPEGARFLGPADPLNPTSFTLTADQDPRGRTLVLYSLGHGKRFASLTLSAAAEER